jgi:hypothetical protein
MVSVHSLTTAQHTELACAASTCGLLHNSTGLHSRCSYSTILNHTTQLLTLDDSKMLDGRHCM